MNYRRIYNELIMRAWRRGGVEGYKEKHHIIPRCQGGGNDRANIVELTAAEHYIAHLLLMKMYPDNYKLAYPILLMGKSEKGCVNNKLYEKARRSVSDGQKGVKRSDKTRAKISNGHKGKRLSEEHISRMSASLKGRTMSDETCAKMSLAKKWNKYALGTKLSDEAKAKISAAQKGKKISPESIAKRLATVAKNKERKELLQFWCAL